MRRFLEKNLIHKLLENLSKSNRKEIFDRIGAAISKVKMLRQLFDQEKKLPFLEDCQITGFTVFKYFSLA